jgi:hypothetical protein
MSYRYVLNFNLIIIIKVGLKLHSSFEAEDSVFQKQTLNFSHRAIFLTDLFPFFFPIPIMTFSAVKCVHNLIWDVQDSLHV